MLWMGGAGMNVVNRSNREGVLSMKVYTMIHLLCQEALQLAMIKSSLVDIKWFPPNMNTAFTHGNYKAIAFSIEMENGFCSTPRFITEHQPLYNK